MWQRAGEFDPLISSPTTWLATIARNQALDETKCKTMRSLEELPDLWHVPSDDNALGVEERNEELDQLRMCLGRLDRETREMVLLVYHHGLTREEIARKNGWPVAAVKPCPTIFRTDAAASFAFRSPLGTRPDPSCSHQ